MVKLWEALHARELCSSTVFSQLNAAIKESSFSLQSEAFQNMHVAVCSEWAFSCARSSSHGLFPTLPSPSFNCYSMVLWFTWHTRTLLQCILKYFIYFNLVRYPSYMWKFVSSVLRLGETLRSALQSGDMVSVICFRAWFKMYSSLFVCFLKDKIYPLPQSTSCTLWCCCNFTQV